jgi:predicted nucleic acid-binding protein
MTKNIFLDTNVVLDLLSMRQPGFNDCLIIFRQIENKTINGFISGLSYSVIFYVISKEIGKSKTLDSLKKLRLILGIAPVDWKVIDLALSSDFKDFEDAIQHYSALEVKSDIIITNNIKDFKTSLIPVMTPKQFVQGLIK